MKKHKLGDRKDGRRVHDLDGMHHIMMHLMPKRTEAEVYLEHTVDVTELLAYVARKNQEHPNTKATVFHCVVTGIGRVIRMRPYLNRFICGRKLYVRDEITLSFVAKRKFQDQAEESLMVVKVQDDTTLDSITKKLLETSVSCEIRKAAMILMPLSIVLDICRPRFCIFSLDCCSG